MPEQRCKRCGSYAINETLHRRKLGKDLDLCDVCYWINQYELELQKRKILEDLLRSNR